TGPGQCIRLVRIMGYHGSIGRQSSRQCGKTLSNDLSAIRNGRAIKPAEEGSLLCLVLLNEFTHLVDGVNRVEIALAFGHTPGEKPMSAKDDAVGTRVVPYRPFDHEGELKSRALPRY